MDLYRKVLLRSNLGNDNIIFLLTPVLKTGVEIERTIFWSEIGSGFGEPGGTPPPQVPRNTPRFDFVLPWRRRYNNNNNNNLFILHLFLRSPQAFHINNN